MRYSNGVETIEACCVPLPQEGDTNDIYPLWLIPGLQIPGYVNTQRDGSILVETEQGQRHALVGHYIVRSPLSVRTPEQMVGYSVVP